MAIFNSYVTNYQRLDSKMEPEQYWIVLRLQCIVAIANYPSWQPLLLAGIVQVNYFL